LIDTLPQNAGGLENYDAAGSEDKIFFGLGIAAAPGIFATDAKFAKAADQDVFFSGQSIFDDIQNAFDGVARFLLTEPELEINSIDNLFFGQGHGRKLLPPT
jgi:hypothetical protein